jgi:hypothetical protein
MTLQRRQRWHHDLQPKQGRGVVAHRSQRRGDFVRRLGPRNHLAQRRDGAGLRPLAVPEQQADFFEGGSRDQLFDWIAAIGEPPFDN